MSNRSWVTLATNDSYGLGALVLAHSLRRVGSQYPATVLITPSVTDAMRERLHAVFAEVVTVDVLDSRDAAHLALLQRPELGVTFTKIHCWELTQYEKCVFLDADTLIVQNCDELFEREQLSAAPDVGWPDCFNSGVFVFKPSQETFYELIKFAEERGSFDGGDQGLLNSFFSDWARGDINKHLPFLYNVTSAAFYSYLPALKHYGQDLKIIHFIGAAKPWLQKYNWESRSVDAPGHLKEFLQLWWDLFVGQVHPQLDANMVEVQEAPPALPPHDVSQHYVPVVDPESEFPWHHPDAQIQEDSSRLEIDQSQFYDPWELYRGFIPSNRNDEPSQHSLTRRIEDYRDMKDYAWQYQSANQSVPYDRESSLPNQTFNPHHHDDSGHQETQPQYHYLQSNWEASSQNNWEGASQHNWEAPSHQNWESHSQHNWEGHSQHAYEDHSQHNWGGQSHQNWESHSQQHWEDTQQNWESHSHGSHTHDNLQYHNQHSQPNYQHWHDENSSQKDHYHNLHENNHENIDFEHKQYPHDHHNSHTHHSHDHQAHSQEPIQHEHYTNDSSQHHKQQIVSIPKVVQRDISIDNIPVLTNEVGRSNVHIHRYKPLDGTNTTENHNGTSNGTQAYMNGDVSDAESDYHEDITPRHPYDGFYLRHRAVIDSHGRKICTHEIPETPIPSPPPETQEVPIFLHAEELFVSNGHAHDEEQSGVAGNLARVVPGASGAQREVLDELTRRQGWEAGNIDYMGADSFNNIWAKISQTLGQTRTSPPKQPSPPPKQPSPPKEQPSVEVANEAAVVEAPISEVVAAPVAAEVPAVPEAPLVEAPVAAAPVVSEVPIEAPVVEKAPVTEEVIVPKEAAVAEDAPVAKADPVVEAPVAKEASVVEAPAVTESPLAIDAPVVPETPVAEARASPVVIPATVEAAAEVSPSEIPATIETAAEPAAAVETPVQATTEPLEIPAPVVAGEAPASKEAVSEPPKEEPTKKTETVGLPTPPASLESAPVPATESPSVEPVVDVVQTAKTTASAEASPVPVSPITTPEKAPESAEATDSPPLANTPSKDGPPVLPDAKSEERRKGAGKLQLKPPSVADPLPTPDSELEDAAALASSIIASELRTPTVTSPGSEGPPATPPVQPQPHRLSVDEPEVPTPPVDTAVSLAQIGVKPAPKPKTSIAAQIESSVTEKAPEAAPVDPPKKKIVKKVVKKDSATSAAAGADAPVPPPRKKEKKPKEK